jgi:lysozyme
MKAAKDTKESTTEFTYNVNNHPDKRTIPLREYVGEGNGIGGNIVMQALWNWQSTTKNNAFLSVTDNNMDIQIGSNFLVTTKNGGQDFSSKMGIKMTTDAAYDLAAKGNIRVGSNGTLNVTSDSDMSLCTSAAMSLSSSSGTAIVSSGDLNIDASTVNINTTVNMLALNATTIKANITDTGRINSKTISIHKRPIGNGSPASPSSPAAATPIIPQAPLSANPARPAEVKPLNEKINILATWEDPNSKFKRNTQSVFTTVSRYLTYEPCPEHADFTAASVSSTEPTLTQPDKTYEGSGGAGNNPTTIPVTAQTPGANNTQVRGDPAQNNSPAKDFNSAAFACQIKIHEGFKAEVYQDTSGTAVGYGHLLRQNEAAMYPLGTPVPMSQINAWFEQDTTTAVKIAQTLCTSWNDLADVRKRALADLAYNLGQPRLSGFSKFLQALNKGDYGTAAKELKDSKWYSQVGKRGPNLVTMIGHSVDPNGCDKKFPG